MRRESLSFRLRQVQTHADLMLACEVRARAYGQKVPEAREAMSVPDSIDARPSTTIFLCEDKRSGAPVGTIRLQLSRGADLLEMERYVELPGPLRAASRAEVTRLAAPLGADPFVRLALWKAAYMFAANAGVPWIVMSVRKPALIRAYRQMGSKDLFPTREEGFVLPYVGAKPHRIYALDIENFYGFWSDTRHPLLEFMTETIHDDIDVPIASVNRQRSEIREVRILE